MKKRIITIVLVCILAGGAVTGAVFGIKHYQKNKLVADVMSVSSLNWGYWGDSMESEGMVTNNASQNVYPESNQIIKEVYVEEGQEVKEGDPLMAYDVTSLQLSLEVKKLAVQSADNKLAVAKKELERLKKTTPVSENTQNQVTQPEEPAFTLPQLTQNNDAYNYISPEALPYNISDVAQNGAALGSAANPYRYLCDENGYVTGSFINALVSGGLTLDSVDGDLWVVLEIREGNSKTGELMSSWTMSPSTIAGCEESSRWSILTKQQIQNEETQVQPEVQPEQTQNNASETVYTKEALDKAIRDKEKELKKLDLDKRKAELELKNLEESATDGVVHAKINGVVKKVGDPKNLPNDGSAFLTVSGSEGLYVKGDISELMLDKVKVGQTVTATSWQSGMTFTAQITEIDTYPDDSDSYYGDGNPNASYYAYMAYIDDPTGLTNGEYLSLTIDTSDEETASSGIYLETAYVRQEDGRYYVMKDEDGVLKKQYVTTGKIISGGSGIEITSGLTEADAIAFPYGKTAQEGVKTQPSDGMMH